MRFQALTKRTVLISECELPFLRQVKFLITILFLIGHLTVIGQTNFYIVGTVHDRTKNFNPDSVLNILTKLNPDLILMELDSSFFDNSFNLKKRIRTNETLGVAKYISKHPIPIRPYDIKRRTLAMNVIEIEAESLQRISSIERSLDSGQRQTFIEFKRTDKAMKLLQKKKPYEINQQYTYALVEKNEILKYKGLLEIIESRKELGDLRVTYKQSGAFWDHRNNKMDQNILLFLNMDDFKNKTIVLFSGFFHKYYLLDQLQPKQDLFGFTIKEYYE